MGQVTPSTEMSKLLADGDEGMIVLDDDAFGTEVETLYQAQEQNYQDYIDSQAAIQQQEAALAQTQDSSFARTEVMEAELELQKQKANQALEDYLANNKLLGKIAPALDDNDLDRFYKLDEKLLDVMAPQLPEPPEPLEPPKALTPTPIGRYFITTGEKMMCPFAMGGQAVFAANPDRKVVIDSKQMGNIMDFKPMVNIPSFGMCSSMANPQVASATSAAFGVLTPMPCVPNVVNLWTTGKMDLIIEKSAALLNTDTCQCLWGGVISFVPKPPEPTPISTPENDDLKKAGKTLGSKAVSEAAQKALEKAGNSLVNKLIDQMLKRSGAIMSSGMVLMDIKLLERAGKIAKIGKAGVAVAATVVVTAVGYALADTSNYAKSEADASQKHAGFKGGSASEWGEVIGDYGAGFWKDVGVPDGVADFGNYMVRDTADTIDALNTVGREMGSSLAESHPAPQWLIDIFG